MLGLFTLYVRHPEDLAQGHQIGRVMFSRPVNVTPEGFLKIDGLRIFLAAVALEPLSGQLSATDTSQLLAGNMASKQFGCAYR